MRAFEVYLNGERLCTVGIGDDGVMNAMVDHVKGNGHDEVVLTVGGLISPTREHVRWKRLELKEGDEVRVKVTESATIDEPEKRYPVEPVAD